MREITEQESFWIGEFGAEYTERNNYDPARRLPQFKKLLGLTEGVRSICEFGANRGLNLRTLQLIDPQLRLSGIEINLTAFSELDRVAGVRAIKTSIQDFTPEETYDLTFTCGVLIHVNPEDLGTAYQRLYEASRRYVLMIEYFNPKPVDVEYRGHHGRLFKRDFAGDFIDHIGADRVRVVDYGFWWRRIEPQWDNVTWTLLERQ